MRGARVRDEARNERYRVQGGHRIFPFPLWEKVRDH